MKLLVTGGAGFIGSNFILYWLNKYPEDQIVNLDKLTYAGNLENLKSVEKHPPYKFIKSDVCDQKLVGQIVKDVDMIVHFAAESHVDRSITDPAPFIQTNIVGTHVLLESALKYSIKRFHHISTDEVFGELPLTSKDKFNELTPYNPRSPYSASKAASDHLVRAYYHTYGLPMTISNCSNNFGPYQFPEKALPLLMTNALEEKPFPLYGSGENVRDWIYVLDHAKAISFLIRKGNVGEIYNIGGTYSAQNKILFTKILELMQKPASLLHIVADRPGHDKRYALNCDKLKRLGWSPETPFEAALEQTINWYCERTDWWQPLKYGTDFQHYYTSQYASRAMKTS